MALLKGQQAMLTDEFGIVLGGIKSAVVDDPEVVKAELAWGEVFLTALKPGTCLLEATIEGDYKLTTEIVVLKP